MVDRDSFAGSSSELGVETGPFTANDPELETLPNQEKLVQSQTQDELPREYREVLQSDVGFSSAMEALTN